MRPRRGNSARRERFAEVLVSNGLNGTQAAIAAGCPPAGARVTASRWKREPGVRQAIRARIWERLDERRRVFVQTYTRPFRTEPPQWISASAAARRAGCPRPGSRVAAYRLVREPLVNYFITTIQNEWWENFERERDARRRQEQAKAEMQVQLRLAAIRKELHR